MKTLTKKEIIQKIAEVCAAQGTKFMGSNEYFVRDGICYIEHGAYGTAAKSSINDYEDDYVFTRRGFSEAITSCRETIDLIFGAK